MEGGVEYGALEEGDGARLRIGRGGVARLEEAAAVAGDGERLVVRAGVEEAEEGEDARPPFRLLTQPLAAAAATLPLEAFAQARERVRPVEDGVLAREEVGPRLGEEEDDETHDDADGGAVDRLVRKGPPSLLERGEGGRVARDEELDGAADALAESGREVGLPLAGVEDEAEEGRGPARLRRDEELRGEEAAQGFHLRAGLPFREEEGEVPLAEGVVVGARVGEAQLRGRGEDREPLAACAEPLEEAGRGALAAADAEARLVGEEDREARAVPSEPEAAGADRLARDGADRERSVDLGAAKPVARGSGRRGGGARRRAGRVLQAGHFFEEERQEV